MRHLKHLSSCFVSLSLIALMAVRLGPDTGRTFADEPRAAPAAQSSDPTLPFASRPLPVVSRLPVVDNRLLTEDRGGLTTDNEPPTTGTMPANVTWNAQGQIQNGELRINDAWMTISSLRADGASSAGAKADRADLSVASRPSPVRGPLPIVDHFAATDDASRITDYGPLTTSARQLTMQPGGCRGQTTRNSGISSLAAPKPSITVNVSPDHASPGSQVTVSGSLPPGAQMPLVRVLFQECDSTHGLAETPVGPDGKFSVGVTIPGNASDGPHDIKVVGGGSKNMSDNLNPPSGIGMIDITTLPGHISGIIQVELPNGTTIPVANAFAKLLENGLMIGLNGPTGSSGQYKMWIFAESTYDIKPGKYMLTAYKSGIVFEEKFIDLKPGQDLTVNITGKYPAGVGECALWKQMNEPQGNVLPMGAQQKSGPIGPGMSNIGTFISMPGRGVPVMNKFLASIPFNVQGAMVQFWFTRPNGGDIIKTVDAQKVLDSWEASVDMSEFPEGDIEVQVAVEGAPNTIGCTLNPSLSFRMIGTHWFEPWVTNPNVIFNGNADRYEFSGALPSPAFAFNYPLNLGITLDNMVSFGIPINETFYINGNWEGNATAQAYVKFLSLDFINESRNYNPSGAFESHTYQLPTIQNSLGKTCFPIPWLHYQFGTNVCLCWFFGCCWEPFVGVSLTADVCVQGFINVDSTIFDDLRPNATVSPGVTLSVPLELKVGLLICSGSAKVEPYATVTFPIACAVGSGCGFENPCLVLGATLHYLVECLGFDIFEGDHELGSIQFGCSTSSASCDQLTAAGERNALHLAPLSPSPSIATDGAGHALAVWIQEESGDSTNPDRHLYYGFYNGTTWSAPARLSSEAALVNSPQVAFLGPNRALTVWVQNKLSVAEALASEPGIVFIKSELYYAQWDGRSWSAPAPITDDEVLDGAPSLSSDPTSGQATLAWLRVNQPTGPDQQHMGIYYASFDGRQWSTPALINAGSSALDYQTTITFDRRGQPVAVWVRDADGNMGTSADRQILISRLDGRAWSAPEAILSLPPGAFAPSLAFDKANNPIVVLAVPPADSETGQPTGGLSNRNELYSAFRRGNTWEVARVGSNAYAEAPVVRVNPDNRAIIMYRQFGTTGDVHVSGDLAAAVADLDAPTLQWTTGYLTADGKVNWEVAFDIDRQTSQNFVLNVKKTPGGEAAEALAQAPKGEQVGGKVAFNTLGGSQASFDTLAQGTPDIAVSSYVVPYAVDLAITPEGIAFSNTHPLVGETITITANVRNAGLKATSRSTPFTMRFYDGDPASGTATLIGEQRVENPIPFNTAVPVSVPYTIQQGGLHTITVVVDAGNAIAESDERNNAAQAMLGRPPAPLQLLVTPQPDLKVITLSWTAPETKGIDYYLIFRAAAAGGNYELVGDTVLTKFTDTLAQPGVTYYYVVIAVDIYGTRSAFSNETTGKL